MLFYGDVLCGFDLCLWVAWDGFVGDCLFVWFIGYVWVFCINLGCLLVCVIYGVVLLCLVVWLFCFGWVL